MVQGQRAHEAVSQLVDQTATAAGDLAIRLTQAEALTHDVRAQQQTTDQALAALAVALDEAQRQEVALRDTTPEILKLFRLYGQKVKRP